MLQIDNSKSMYLFYRMRKQRVDNLKIELDAAKNQLKNELGSDKQIRLERIISNLKIQIEVAEKEATKMKKEIGKYEMPILFEQYKKVMEQMASTLNLSDLPILKQQQVELESKMKEWDNVFF